MTIIASPIALGMETGMRVLLFPPEFSMLRELLRSTLTPVAWGIAVLAGVGAMAGLALQKRLVAKRIGRLPESAPPARRFQAATEIFLFTTALPQVPSLFASFCFTFGASIVPVLVAITLTSAGVIAQAIEVPKLAR